MVIFTGEAVIPAFVESLPAPPFEDSTPSSVPVETWLLELVKRFVKYENKM